MFRRLSPLVIRLSSGFQPKVPIVFNTFSKHLTTAPNQMVLVKKGFPIFPIARVNPFKKKSKLRIIFLKLFFFLTLCYKYLRLNHKYLKETMTKIIYFKILPKFFPLFVLSSYPPVIFLSFFFKGFSPSKTIQKQGPKI
ncbi:MAG: hypothetical protein CM15mV127_250 [Caudoviricetes sp.]|nr:MAG: hypothetical protein CM15mV127_250 [Caudoviricetes sp.]